MAIAEKTVRRIGVLGDIHAHERLLERALDFFSGLDLCAILSVGDIVDGEGDLERTIALLKDAGVEAVRGNHERWLLAGEERHRPNSNLWISEETRRYLEALPPLRRYQTPRGGLLLGHGVFDDDMASLRPSTKGYELQEIKALFRLMKEPGVDYFIGGHTHERFIRAFPGVTFINAGTLSAYGETTFLIADFEDALAHFYAASELRPPALLESLSIPPPLPYQQHQREV